MDKIIAISRQYGSGGRQIGQKISKLAGVPFYDKEVIQRAACKSGIHTSHFTTVDQGGGHGPFYTFAPGAPLEMSLSDKIYLSQRDVILELADKGPCVIVGRGACEILKDRYPLLRVLIYADLQTRIRRALEEYHEPSKNIEKQIAEIDKKRMSYYSFYEGKAKQITEYFDICIDSGSLGLDGTAQVILAACAVAGEK